MEISVGELHTRIHATDAPLLDPALLERIVALVLARVREEQERERRAASGRRLLQDERGGW